MSSRASGGALAACLITAAIVGFAGGAYFGTQSGNAESPGGSTPSATSPATTPNDGGEQGGAADGSTDETPAAGRLTLSSPQTAVEPNGRIDITGAISPPEQGVHVQLQRSVDDGPWENFNVSPWTTGNDGSFSGRIQSQRQGVNSLRVVRVDDETVMSNVIEVTIG